MANKFFGFLGHLGLVVAEDIPQAIAVVYPPLSGLMGVISSLTLKVKADNSTVNGPTLKAQVISDFSLVEPFLAPLIQQLSGKAIDPVAFQAIVSDANDLAVKWHQLLGTLPPSGSNSAPAPAPSAPTPIALVPQAPVPTSLQVPGVVIPLSLQNAVVVKP